MSRQSRAAADYFELFSSEGANLALIMEIFKEKGMRLERDGNQPRCAHLSARTGNGEVIMARTRSSQKHELLNLFHIAVRLFDSKLCVTICFQKATMPLK